MMSGWRFRERRRYLRIEKNFVISYFSKSDPQNKHEISQIKNISLGGMCFVTAEKYKPQTRMGIDLKTPYFAETVHVEGTVLDSREKVRNMIYETHLAFDKLSEQAEIILKKIVSTFSNQQ